MARPFGQIGTSLAGTHSPFAALHKSDSYRGFKGGAEMEYARGTSAGVTMRSQTALKMNS
jgi:hypothetical protein